MKGQKLPWFRMYVDFLEDPKMIGIAFEDQRHFIGVLALKSAGILDQECHPDMRDRIIAQKLWIDHAIIRDVKRRLVEARLIDSAWQPLGWDKRQYPSDSSYERVKRHREKRAAEGLPQQTYIPKKTRQFVYDRDGHACVYCGSPDDLSLDHDVPQSRGGGDEVENLVTACRTCNGAKRDMTGSEFRERNVKRFSNGADREEDTDKEQEKHMSSGASPDCAPKTTKRKQGDYTPEFEQAWQQYPTRPGNSKADAFKAWSARLKAGATAEQMLAGVQRYAAYCAAERTEPRYIKQAATFFGPGEHFMGDWTPTKRVSAMNNIGVDDEIPEGFGRGY